MSHYSAATLAIKHLSGRLSGDGRLTTAIRDINQRIENLAAALAKLHDQPDPMLSDLAINLRFEAARAELVKVVASAAEKSADLLATERRNVEINRAQKANLTPSPYAAELRAVFRGLSPADKIDFMERAVAENDGGQVAAITTVPTALTGLAPDRAAHYQKILLSRLAPLDDAYIFDAESVVNGVIAAASSMFPPPVTARPNA